MIKYDYEQINKSEFAEGLVMIHYDIDTTENGYKKFEGNIELLIELKHILFKNDVVPDLVGYLSFDNIPNVSICLPTLSSAVPRSLANRNAITK